jgi:hypothetical protein
MLRRVARKVEAADLEDEQKLNSSPRCLRHRQPRKTPLCWIETYRDGPLCSGTRGIARRRAAFTLCFAMRWSRCVFDEAGRALLEALDKTKGLFPGWDHQFPGLSAKRKELCRGWRICFRNPDLAQLQSLPQELWAKSVGLMLSKALACLRPEFVSQLCNQAAVDAFAALRKSIGHLRRSARGSPWLIFEQLYDSAEKDSVRVACL